MSLLSANLSFFVRLTIKIWTDTKLFSFSDKQKRTKMSKFTDFLCGFRCSAQHVAIIL